MERILFICEGNVGRSQMAQGFYNQYAGKELGTSAGVTYVGPKYNYIPRADVIEVMREKGIDISGQRIHQVTQESLDGISKIVVLCDPKFLPYFVRESGINTLVKDIKDPYESSKDGLVEVRDSIEKIVLELLDKISNDET